LEEKYSMAALSDHGYQVLLAHESEEVLDSVEGFLEEQGDSEGDDFFVITSTEKQEVSEEVEEKDVDCVVSGRELEDTGGVELLRDVKDGNSVPFVLFLGDASSSTVKEAIEEGATDYLRTTMREFVAAVEDPGREQQDILANRVKKIVDRERMRTNYRELFDKANDAIFVENPETGDILDVNQKMCEMHGYTREEARDLHVSDVSANQEPFTPEKALENLEKAMEEGSHFFEWKNKKKNGELFWVEVSLKRATIGGEERILAIVRDISERKEYEELLEEREKRYRRVFEKHSAPMLLIEPDSGGIVNANEAASDLYGYTHDELTSMEIDEINTLSEKEVERRRAEAENEERDTFVFPHRTKSGEVKRVEVNSVPIETERGTLLFSILRDTEVDTEAEETDSL
jgi:PAS domain S-box-containing protein